MKKILLSALTAVLLMTVCVHTAAKEYTFDWHTDTVYVQEKDYATFVKTPWKCVITTEKGDTLLQAYYNRQGEVKACGYFRPQGQYSFTVYDKNGESFDVYNTSAKLNENGELVKNGVKQLYQKAWVAFTFKNLPDRLRHNTTSHMDKYGNWTFAGDTYRDGIIRHLYYYEDGYDEAEDKAVDEVCSNAIELHQEATSFKLGYIPVIVVALLIKLVWLVLVIYLILLLFKREWAYRPFNRYAGERVTPYGLFCKSQLLGLIPVALLFLPSLLLFGTVTMRDTQRGVESWACIMLASLAVSLFCCWLLVKKQSEKKGRKKAIATVAFAVWSILALVAIIAIAVVAIWVAIVLVFLFAGLSSAIGGFISGGASGVLGKGAGTGVHGKCCNNCKFYAGGHQCGHHAMGNTAVDPMNDVCKYYIGG